MIKKLTILIKKLLVPFYFYDNGHPKRCTHCHSNNLDYQVKATDCGYESEKQYFCTSCKHIVGYWAYGYFDPCFLMYYLMVDDD
jgi:hypothetical protein